MHLFYADETSLDPARHEFFVYGGLAIPSDTCFDLHSKCEAIRQAFRIPADFLVKFNPGPSHLDHPQFIDLKKALIAAACEANCRFLSTIFLHKIGTMEKARLWEINRLSFHFNSFLSARSSHGLILIDRFSDKQLDPHLREKFQIGLRDMPYSKEMRLGRVMGFHYSAIGQSNFPSLIDILIGSLRFVVDAFSHDSQVEKDTARILLAQMGPLFERCSDGRVSVLSLNFDPKVIKADAYRTRYQSLKDFFTSCGLEPEQAITDHRQY